MVGNPSGLPGRDGVGVVVNPHTRRNRRRDGLTERLARLVGDRGVVAASDDRERLLRIAEDFRRQRIDVLALCGGDGTVGFTLTAFYEVYGDEPLPGVALLRGGTMNTIANAVGTPRRPMDRLLRDLVRSHSLGRGRLSSAERVALSVRTGEGSDVTERLGFLFGTGLARGFLEEYYAASDDPTPWTAAVVLARLAASSVRRGEMSRRVGRRIELDVTVDGERWPRRAYVGVLVGTVEQTGLGFRPFHGAREGAEAFHLVGVHGTMASVAINLWRVRIGRTLGDSRAQDATGRAATLRSHGAPIAFFLDGDLHEGAAALELAVGPRVRFVW